MATPEFEADEKIAMIAEAYALDAVDLFRRRYRIELDWTDNSIDRIETVSGHMHESYRTTRPKPDEEMLMEYAKAFGSYIGEVFRRNHGGEWGMVTLDGRRLPGFRSTKGRLFWPWSRARSRLVEGPEENVAHYYHWLLRD